jgi:UDP-2,3-diacylglucosamine pyrophosphatase LpxH
VKRFLIILSFLSFLSSCKDSEPELKFVFMGDLHYKIPDYRTADYLVPAFVKEIDTMEVKPEFILLTGDFFHGGKGTDINSESQFAFNDFKENVKIPFFISKGNHDSREYFEKLALPLYTAELKKNITRSYFSFTKSNCHFIILDCTTDSLDNELDWLEEDLKAAKSDPAVDHIFVAGHYPLWIVARAGFTRKEYAAPVASLLARYKVDAYFCGHTHNKTLTVRTIDGQPLTQIMDAAVVEEGRISALAPFLLRVKNAPEDIDHPGILALEESHQIFLPESQSEYLWGYQEGSTSSYYVITVKGKSVKADWHVLGEGITRSASWDRPGIPVEFMAPDKEQGDKIGLMRNVEKAWLYTAPWTDEDTINAPFFVNGTPAGRLEISRKKMAASPFWNKTELLLDSTLTGAIRMDNEITILNPEKKRFGLAHVFLLVQFADGLFARSSISGKVVTSFTAEEGQYPDFPENELIEQVNRGDTLKKLILHFDRYYKN